MWWDCIANELAGSREPRLFLFLFIINSATLIISLDCHHFFLRISIINARGSWTGAVPVCERMLSRMCVVSVVWTHLNTVPLPSIHTAHSKYTHTHKHTRPSSVQAAQGDKTYGSRQNEAVVQVNKTVPGKYWRVLIWHCGRSTEKAARAVKQTHRASQAASRSPCKLSRATLWDYSNHIYLLTLN